MFAHPLFQKDPDSVYLPYLQLLGILYAVSTYKMKAVSFYHLVKVEGTNRIPKNDPFLLEYLQKLLELAFTMALELHDCYCSENERQAEGWSLRD